MPFVVGQECWFLDVEGKRIAGHVAGTFHWKDDEMVVIDAGQPSFEIRCDYLVAEDERDSIGFGTPQDDSIATIVDIITACKN